MERRGFLRDIAKGAATLAAGLVPYSVSALLTPGHATPVRNYLRPPGVLKDDGAFVAACIACGLCGEVCPPKCIDFHKRDGGFKVNTPYIVAEEKACILCNKCMEVCPTEALGVIPREKVDMGLAQIDRTACYPWVDRGICGACVSICPMGEKAIGFKLWNQYQPFIKHGCVGCGLCVEICPHPLKPIAIVDRAQGSVARHKV